MKNNPRAALEDVFKAFLQKALPETKEKEGLIKDLAPKLVMTCMGKMNQGKGFAQSMVETLQIAMTIIRNEKQKVKNAGLQDKSPTLEDTSATALMCAIVLSQVGDLEKNGISPSVALSHLGKFDASVVGDSAIQELTVEKAAGQAQGEVQLDAEAAEWAPQPKPGKGKDPLIEWVDLAPRTADICEGMKSENTLGASTAPKPTFGSSGI